MRRQLLANGGFVVSLNLLVKPIWILLIDREMQNLLGPGTYGTYYTLLSLSLMLSALLDAGLANFNTRAVAAGGLPALKDMPLMTGLKAALWLLYMVSTLGMGWYLGYPPSSLYWLLLLGIQQGLHSFNLLLRSILSGQLRFVREGWMGVLDKWLMTSASFPLVWLGWRYGSGDPISEFIWIQLLSTLVPTLLMGFMLGSQVRLMPAMAWPQQFSLLRRVFPFALLGLLAGMYTRADLLMIRALLPDAEMQAGWYASGYRLLDAANMIPILFSGILLPQFSHFLSKNALKPEWVRSVTVLMLGMGLCLSWGLVTMRFEWMSRLYAHQSGVQTAVLYWIGLCCVPISLSYVWGTLLTAAGRLKPLILMAVGALFLNIVLNLWLIPLRGAEGAAISTLFTHLVLCIGQGFYSIRLLTPAIAGTRWPAVAGILLLFTATTAILGRDSSLPLRAGLTIVWPLLLLATEGISPRNLWAFLQNRQNKDN